MEVVDDPGAADCSHNHINHLAVLFQGTISLVTLLGIHILWKGNEYRSLGNDYAVVTYALQRLLHLAWVWPSDLKR